MTHTLEGTMSEYQVSDEVESEWSLCSTEIYTHIFFQTMQLAMQTAETKI